MTTNLKVPKKYQRDYKLALKRMEFKKDPILFMESNIKIPTVGGDELIKLYEPQKQVIKDFLEHNHLIILKSRQLGFSTLCQAIVTYICCFYENCIMGVLSRSGDEASDFCRKTEDMIDKLPSWIKPVYKNRSVQSFIIDNGCALWSSAISPTNPSSVFRGKSISFLIMDELAHMRYADISWTGIAPALSKSQNTARLSSIPYGTIFLSTPNRTNGIGKFFYDNWVSAKNETSLLKPIRVHWKEIPEYANDPIWYYKQCSLLNNDKNKIAQELELKFISSDDALFSEKIQEQLQEQTKNFKPLEKIRIPGRPNDKGLWRINNINKQKFHIMSIDTASESGSDYSAIQVIEYETMKQVIEYRGKLSVKSFIEIIKFVELLTPHNIIVVENNSYGNQVVEDLTSDEKRRYNLFGEWKRKSNKKGDFVVGINTNIKTRPLIIDALFTYVTEETECIESERLAYELLSLTSKRNKIEADTGCTDDLVMSYAFICYVRHYCNQLLGNTDPMEGMDGSESKVDVTHMILSFNIKDSPLKTSYAKEEYDIFKQRLDKYICENIGVNLKGTVDVTKLYKGKFDATRSRIN